MTSLVIKANYYSSFIVSRWYYRLFYELLKVRFYLLTLLTLAKRKEPLPEGDLWIKLSFLSPKSYHILLSTGESAVFAYSLKELKKRLALL